MADTFFTDQRKAREAPPEGGRLTRLDGLRGLAACAVAFPYHGRILFDPAGLADGRYGPVLGWLQEWGWTFVDLFFLLSGYVFAHVYLARGSLTRRGGLADFAVARLARLYPLHLVLLLCVAAFRFGLPGNGIGAFAANLFMLQAFVRPFAESFNGPSWSLSVEVVCYALFAISVAAGARAARLCAVGLTVFAVICLLAFGKPGGPWVSDVFLRGLLGFFMGQLLWRGRGLLSRVPSLLLAAALVAGMLLVNAPISPLLPLGLLAWPAALLLALRLPAMASAPLAWLGDRSYAIYLINLPLIWAALHLWGLWRPTPLAMVSVHAGLVAATLILSDLSFRLLETPARRAIRAAWQGVPGGAAPGGANPRPLA